MRPLKVTRDSATCSLVGDWELLDASGNDTYSIHADEAYTEWHLALPDRPDEQRNLLPEAMRVLQHRLPEHGLDGAARWG
jgi:hypothetical protein